jgi:hypothetical protein
VAQNHAQWVGFGIKYAEFSGSVARVSSTPHFHSGIYDILKQNIWQPQKNYSISMMTRCQYQFMLVFT